MFEAVLFDCDGVLVDSEILATRALHRSIQNLGMDYTEQQVATTFTGHSFPDCIKMVEQRLGTPIPDLDKFKDDNRQFSEQLMRTELKTMPGIEAVLAELTHPYALVTNSRTFELQLKLGVTGLDQYFPEARRFDSEKLAVAKPDPAIYRRAAESIGVDITRCLVVEDSVPGLTAATRAGATVWAYRPHATPEQLEAFGVASVFHDWSEFRVPRA
ncbi:HAD family hydrolase [Marinimicrobium agarilyticum]|uniref:HAD family hydrolase n=1 Tax=Marinimicrobium agarilyticum TaxID=306546 RepID=UPI0003FED1C5|nr:HAD family phosphatase [Marinimicrobium agarilyticum]